MDCVKGIPKLNPVAKLMMTSSVYFNLPFIASMILHLGGVVIVNSTEQ